MRKKLTENMKNQQIFESFVFRARLKMVRKLQNLYSHLYNINLNNVKKNLK